MNKTRIIVVGNGMVGHNFIDTVATSEIADQFEIITFSEEPRLAYDRVQLSKYFSGSTADTQIGRFVKLFASCTKAGSTARSTKVAPP